MKKHIIRWYNERHFQPYKVIKRGKELGLSERKVKAAMVHCYNRIKSGKQVPDIEVAKYIFNVARDNIAVEYEKELLTADEYKAEAYKWRFRFFMITGFMGVVIVNVLILLYIKYGV